MQRTRRAGIAPATAAALGLALTACAGSPEPNPGAAPPPLLDVPTTVANVPGPLSERRLFGTGCDPIPPDLVADVADDPVTVAVTKLPMLTDFAAAIATADLAGGLSDLADPSASFTVFAPADAATAGAALTPDALAHHVLPRRFGIESLAEAGRVATVGGAPLSLSGQVGTLLVGEQGAQVLCGNIPTANATVFVIDEVLRPG